MNEQAFRGAVESLSPALLRIAFAFTRDTALAEAIVRAAWLGTISAGDPDLRSTVLRLVVDKARAAGCDPGSFHRSVQETSVPRPTVDPSRFRPEGEQWVGHWVAFLPAWPSGLDKESALVAAALKALPEAERVVVSLRDEQGCTAGEVCEYLELSDAQQRALLHRGRARVRQAVQEYVDATGRSRGVGSGPACLSSRRLRT